MTASRLAEDLLHAVERGEIRVHYLPIVSLADCSVVGVEALARWRRAGQDVEAEEFLDAALKTGAIVAIGRHVTGQACREVARWNSAHPAEPLRLAVNASIHQLLDPSAVEEVARLLTSSGLAPRHLCLEVREDTLNELGEGVGAVLERLKDLGVRLSVDDFGTGASSLVALQRHRVDELKIDRSFVARMDVDKGAAAIVRGVAQLARSLDLELVAEGVERPAQEQMLHSLRCEAAQGWLYARPGEDLGEVVSAARSAVAASAARRPQPHHELWDGLPTAGAAARFVEAAFETSPIGMVLVDDEGRTLAVNPSASALLGHPAGSLIGRACWEHVHPTDLQADLAGVDRLLRGECTSYVVEQQVIGADGAPRWVEVTVSGLPGDSQARGNPTRLLRQVRSIADERQAGEDTTLLRSIIAASPDALVIVDATGRCTHWNRAAERLFGWPSEEMVGAPLSRLVRAEHQLALARMVAEAAAGTAARWSDATWLAADGGARAVDVTIGPVHDAEGSVVGLVALARDVADQRAADQALREAHQALEVHAEELALANERLGTFATAVSHDLLQPVAALAGFLSLLERHAVELHDEHREWLGLAIRGKDRVAEAIRALHTAATEDQVPLGPVALGPVLDDVTAGSGAVEPSEVVVSGELPIVMADRGLLAQVLANLTQNSARYRSEEPLRIELTAERAGASWEVRVTDNGLGIDPDELEAVFERGRRGRAGQTAPGTGTGLATVRSLMGRMGGEVWAEAHDGGARIALRFTATDG